MAWCCIVQPPDRRRIGWRSLAAAVAVVLIGASAPTSGRAQTGFPFGRELLMEASPIEGSKRVPILDIAENGLAEITLWCASVTARLIVVADTITVLLGPKTTPACGPEQARRDEELLSAFSEATNWRIDQDVLVLSGGPAALRFYIQTN